MSHRCTPSVFAALAATLLGVLATASVATSWPYFLDAFQNRYPASQTANNVINGTGVGCQVCHQDLTGGNGWNGYGWKVLEFVSVTGDINAALADAEPFDSDLDPTGSSNIDEITASTQPGWTDGPNNTIYFHGAATPGQSPPAGILGSLDPAGGGIGTTYCSPAVASSTGMPGIASASGSVVAADNDVTLTASDLPPSQFGYFITSQSQGYFMPPASQGFICLGSPIGRLNQPGLVGQGPSFSIQLDLTSIPLNPPQAVQPGDTWNFQAWYRDVGNTNNFTDGVSILFQ